MPWRAVPEVPTPPLRAFDPSWSFAMRPLARLLRGGFVEFHDAWIPSPGPCALVVWREGRDPALALVRGALSREGAAWRFEGPDEGWILLWVPEGAQGPRTKGL